MSTTRRQFLTLSAGVSTLALFAARTRGQAGSTAAPSNAKPAPFKISLAQWSYHDAHFKKTLDPVDFPKAAKQVHHIEAVELVNTFYKDKVKDAAYLRDFKARADDLGVKILLIMCDGEGELAHADEKTRIEAVENHKKWADAAKGFGCHSMRVNAYGTGTPEEHMKQSADGLSRLSDYAQPLGLNVIVENHGGLSSNGEWLAGVMKLAGRKTIGTLPDFGNFRIDDKTEYDRYKGTSELMPYAKAVSAKCYDFDEKGEETTIDFKRMCKIVLDAGYHGHVGIEYEGSRLSEKDGVDAAKKLLDKLSIELA